MYVGRYYIVPIVINCQLSYSRFIVSEDVWLPAAVIAGRLRFSHQFMVFRDGIIPLQIAL